jgi:hypothetical protein
MKNLKWEIRLDIKWYEWLYQVSNMGRILSVKRGIKRQNHIMHIKERICKPWYCKWYYIISLHNKWRSKTLQIHRLVLSSFSWREYRNEFQVNHIDWIKSNNKLKNLERCTPQENTNHSMKIWTFWSPPRKWKKGENHNCSKKINQLDTYWNIIKTRWSMSDVKTELWIMSCNISRCCWKKTWRKLAWWFKREYV